MKPGDVHWVELPPAGGHEQSGRRPGIVLQDDDAAGGSPLVLVVPLTSVLSASRFPGTVPIEPTPENGLNKTSLALVLQLRATDRSRVKEQIGAIDPNTLAAIFAALDGLMGRS